MRIMGFSRKDWQNYLTGRPKLEESIFTTFRFTRRDRDWEVGEVVQVVYKPRRKGGGEKLGTAKIFSKEPRWVSRITELLNVPPVGDTEAKADGFSSGLDMRLWMRKIYSKRVWREPMNKLTLRWVEHREWKCATPEYCPNCRYRFECSQSTVKECYNGR